MPLFGKKENEAQEDKKRILPSFNASKFKPNIDTSKLKGSIRNINISTIKLKGSLKWVTWIMRKIRKRGIAFPLFMIFVNALYLTLGGLVFMCLEKTPKIQISTSKDLVDIFDVLKNSRIGHMAFPVNMSGGEIVKNLTSTDLDKFENVLVKINGERTSASKPEWNILNSIFFCMTVTTTIGYGTLAPVTIWGRIICVFYALLGIPLTLALLAVVGKIVGDYINNACALVLKWFQHLYPQYEYESRNEALEDGEIDAPLWLGLLILFVFTTITSGLCCWMEGWDFGTSFYFQYVTYLTIGFGDVVPSKEQFVFINILLTLFGLAVLSVTLSLIASNLHHQVQKASFIEKLKEKELSESTASAAGSAEGIGEEEYGNGNRARKTSEGDTGSCAMNDGNGGKTYGSTQESRE